MNLRSIPRIAAILTVAALPACAAETGAQAQAATNAERPVQMAQGHGHGHHRMHGHHGPRAGMVSPERIEGRLAFLKTELKISEAQAPQWNAFADFMRTQAKAMQARHAEFRERHKAEPKAEHKDRAERREARPLTERLAAHEKFMEQRLDRMRAFKAAVEPLYNVLSPEQRKTADQLLARRHA
jgi:Spy/CpxP family protein refolding chaperone